MVTFLQIRPSKTVRSRTIAWVCISCMEKDEHYNLPAFDTPGMKSPGKERVENAKRRLDEQGPPRLS